MANGIIVRPLLESDLEAADLIFRVAFGTFLGLPDPARFAEDRDYVRTRWRSNPKAALAVEVEGRLAGSNFAADWGSVGFFGPITIDPRHWGGGASKALLKATMQIFEDWGTGHIGLFTFPHSPKHVGLYQSFGFWPRYLTALLSSPVVDEPAWRPAERFSELSRPQRDAAVRDARRLTDSVYPGLDLGREIESVLRVGLGDTVFLRGDKDLAAMAVCHFGRGTEAGDGVCYIKFAAVHPGPAARPRLNALLDACHLLAASRGLKHLEVGVNLANHRAYRALLARGFRAKMQGVAMHRPNQPGYCRQDRLVLSDWR